MPGHFLRSLRLLLSKILCPATSPNLPKPCTLREAYRRARPHKHWSKLTSRAVPQRPPRYGSKRAKPLQTLIWYGGTAKMHPCRGEKARSRQLTRTLVRRHGLARQVPYRWRSLRIGHFSEVIRGHPKPIEVIRSKNLAHPPIFPSLFEPISEPIQVNPNLSAAIRSNH